MKTTMNPLTDTSPLAIRARLERANDLSRFRIWYNRVYVVYSTYEEPTREDYEKSIIETAEKFYTQLAYVCNCLNYYDLSEKQSND